MKKRMIWSSALLNRFAGILEKKQWVQSYGSYLRCVKPPPIICEITHAQGKAYNRGDGSVYAERKFADKPVRNAPGAVAMLLESFQGR